MHIKLHSFPKFIENYSSFIEPLCKREKDLFKYNRNRGIFSYQTEFIIPNDTSKHANTKLNLALVVGNPATSSVAHGFPYAYKERAGNKIRHHFWGKLKNAGVLKEYTKSEEMNPKSKDIDELNIDFKKGRYTSDKYRVFIYPFYSFPTPTKGKYRNVAGIEKLFGKEQFKKVIIPDEQKRFKNLILKKLSNMQEKGVVIFCVTNSYDAIKSDLKVFKRTYKNISFEHIQLIGPYSKRGKIMRNKLNKYDRFIKTTG